MKPNFNLFAHFETQFKRHADKTLITTLDKQTISYAEIDKLSAQLARYLTQIGTQVGDRVSVQVKKSPTAFALYLACLRGGFVFHPLNTGYRPAELEYFFGNAKPSVIVCDEINLQTIQSLANSASVQNVLTLNGNGRGTLTDGAAQVAGDPVMIELNRDDMAALLYSSGTTGVPKGIMLSHGNLLSNAEALIAAWGFSEHDRLLHALPIFHVHGLFVALGCVLLSGASMNWLNAYNPEDVIKTLPNSTVMMGVPTFYTRLLAADGFSKEVCNNMRLFISGCAFARRNL